ILAWCPGGGTANAADPRRPGIPSSGRAQRTAANQWSGRRSTNRLQSFAAGIWSSGNHQSFWTRTVRWFDRRDLQTHRVEFAINPSILAGPDPGRDEIARQRNASVESPSAESSSEQFCWFKPEWGRITDRSFPARLPVFAPVSRKLFCRAFEKTGHRPDHLSVRRPVSSPSDLDRGEMRSTIRSTEEMNKPGRRS